VAFMTVLLGLPWQALQIPFAFLNGLPILLAAYFFLICRPFGRARLDFGLAGMLSAVLVLLKVNVGAYLVAGGAFYLIYWLPPAKGAAPRAVGKNWFWIGQLLILATYVVVFLLHVQHRVDPLFYLYFDVPLLLAAVA